MADPRGNMSHELRRYSGPLLNHLLFLVYFKNEPSYNHWRGEAFGFFPHFITRFKGSHKFPSLKFLEQSIFRWLSDSDAVPSHFKYTVAQKGLELPADFEVYFPEAILIVEEVLHEATKILAADHKIESFQFSKILRDFGL
jgi:hypothetical protein